MLRIFKLLGWSGLLLASLSMARAFSLLGPVGVDTWQIQEIGYMLDGDAGGPKNLGEEYRWNTPTLYYSFDQNFLGYFGSNGVRAVSQAFNVFNALTNVSGMDLSKVPVAVKKQNYRARAAGLLDLKSRTMELLIEQLGLADPVRYVWTLHDRYTPSGVTCPGPGMDYLIVNRNFSLNPSALDQYQSSGYINGILYTYQIRETCQAPNPLALAVPISTDSYYDYAPVASGRSLTGDFYTGLTRDDVGGLRYLLNSNNINFEATGPGVEMFFTNNAALQILTTSNLAQLASDTLTNDAAALQALYPNLLITSVSWTFTTLVTTNLTPYYTNYPWGIPGQPPLLAYTTNYFTNVGNLYQYTFGNIITNTYYSNSYVSVMITNVQPAPYGLAGQIVTNVTANTYLTNLMSGDYYLIPTNACGVVILSNVLSQLIVVTNGTTIVTNTTNPAYTNQLYYSVSTASYFTNHNFAIAPVLCITNAPGLRRGVEKINFVRRDYDSLLGQAFQPVTNIYPMVTVQNNTNAYQIYRRIVTAPDVLLTAADLPWMTPAGPTFRDVTSNVTFDDANALPNLAGPGTITSPVVFTYNRVGVVLENVSPFLSQRDGSRLFTWGSFDGGSGAPIYYPNGTSIENLESQIIMQITTANLPAGQVNINYPAPGSIFLLSGSGGQPPYIWSQAPSSAGMPPGLSVFSDGTIGGRPTQDGVYDIIIRMTDAGARYVERSYTLTVNP